ncbi:McrC family protein [Candidatus Poriferisodalis sp.]|uniref:McrC family protein n=1 Tax=Candidatus Poriferisodalis sp. TaxID=3101277 RepID=UPI003B011824
MPVVDTLMRSSTAAAARDDDGLPPLLLTESEPESLDLTQAQANALAKARGRTGRNWLQLDFGEQTGRWIVTPRNFVGSFIAAGLSVIVRPKIKPENLFALLEVGLPRAAWRQEATDYASTYELLPALVSFFARTAETALARGLFHHYRRDEGDLLALRGRIDFARQFRRGGVLVPIACSWEEFTPDVDENRCLRVAARRSLQVQGVPGDDQRRLHRLLAALDSVGEPAVSTALNRLHWMQYTRLNEHYRPALGLARLILSNFTLQDRHGDTSASAFMLDMNRLFENFITTRLQRKLGSLFDVREQATSAFGESEVIENRQKHVSVRPDLLLRQGGRVVGVADIKYKLAARDKRTDPDGAYGRASDYYQLLAYATALKLKEGTLIYCTDVNRDESSEPDGPVGSDRASSGTGEASNHDGSVTPLVESTITVQHVGTKLHAIAIDLSGSPSSIDAQINALAGHLETSAERSVAP